LRAWAGLKTDTAAPPAPTRSRSKTGVTRSPPKDDTTGYVAAIVGQLSPDNIIRHEHPAGSEETNVAATKLRERFGPDAAPRDKTSTHTSNHGAAHKCCMAAASDKTSKCLNARAGTGRHAGGEASQNERKPTPERHRQQRAERAGPGQADEAAGQRASNRSAPHPGSDNRPYGHVQPGASERRRRNGHQGDEGGAPTSGRGQRAFQDGTASSASRA
jgi:hypothetical protein